MTAVHAARDTATMVRRNLLHMRRYPSLTLMLVLLPVVFLLLFVDVFGATIGSGLSRMGVSSSAYANYVTPAIILLTVASGCTATAISVATDMTEGIIDRFRTMAIWRPAVLAGHVLGGIIQTFFTVVVVVAVALLVGFRPASGALEWLAAIGVLALITMALTWLSVALGLVAKSVEGASNAFRISELRRLRRELAGLTVGERLVLPAEVAELLDRMQSLGVSSRTMTLERDGWTLLVALSPEQASRWALDKTAALADPDFRRLYLAWEEAYDWAPDDPRLIDLAGEVTAWLARKPPGEPPRREAGMSAVHRLLSAQFDTASPSWQRLDELCRAGLRGSGGSA